MQPVYRPLNVARAISFGSTYLVETLEEPDDWYMGEAAADGVVRCWGRYGSLAEAIKGL
jgi:hypothetical protein